MQPSKKHANGSLRTETGTKMSDSFLMVAFYRWKTSWRIQIRTMIRLWTWNPRSRCSCRWCCSEHHRTQHRALKRSISHNSCFFVVPRRAGYYGRVSQLRLESQYWFPHLILALYISLSPKIRGRIFWQLLFTPAKYKYVFALICPASII